MIIGREKELGIHFNDDFDTATKDVVRIAREGKL